jgi:hypothetical protein
MPLHIDGVLSDGKIVETRLIKSAASDPENYFGPFVGNKSRPLFHRPNCKWMRFVHRGDRVHFKSHALAVADGRKPCKTCKA